MMADNRTILDLFQQDSVVRMCAPMVRYSKLPFRKLVRKYNCHLAFSPMIVSESFVRSQKARDVELTTDPHDRPLVVQFAANNVDDFSLAASMVAPYVDGVDLNCGCPQHWALQKHYGAYLITKPQLICDMVHSVKRRSDIPVSIKIRIHNDIRLTVELAKRCEVMGIAWITVHGRTTTQRAEPVNLEAIKLIKDSIAIPVIANGDIKTEADVTRTVEETGVDGVMAARGILANPAMYSGYTKTPLQCVQDWVDLSLSCGVTFTSFHHHLMFMMEGVQSKIDRRVFNNLKSTPAVLDFLQDHYGVRYCENNI